MTSRTTWTDPAQLTGRSVPATDEFSADVAEAVRDLRARHGLADDGSQGAVSPGMLDTLRAEMREALPGVSRRGFLRLTGAAAVLSLVTACKSHPDTVVPQPVQPDGSVLGMPRLYSTVLRDSGRPVAVAVKCYDGRPIKIEGNPDHPLTQGRADAATQAALLNLYDPDRGHAELGDGPMLREGSTWKPTTWAALDAACGKALANGRIGLISGAIDSPAQRALLAEMKAALGGRLRHAVLDASADAVLADELRRLGSPTTAFRYRPAKAAVMLTLGGDFLADEDLAAHVGYGDFRRGNSQLIAIEATLSQTGIAADVRRRCDLDRIGAAGWLIAKRVGEALGVPLPAAVANSIGAVELLPIDTAQGSIAAVDWIADQLIAAQRAGKPTLVYAAGHAQGGDVAARISAALWLNKVLGNFAVTVLPVAAPEAELVTVDALLSEPLDALILWNANPAYVLGQATALKSVTGTVIVLGDRVDESASAATVPTWFAPTLHALECWGDADTGDGVLAIQQPCIQRLWDARAAEESLMAWTIAAVGDRAPASFRQEAKTDLPVLPAVVSRKPLWQAAAAGVADWGARVRALWATQIRERSAAASSADAFVVAALASGVVRVPVEKLAFVCDESKLVTSPAAPRSGLRLSLRPSRTIGQGTWANNAWLQELPDPVSKITWDNWLAVSPTDADALRLAENDVVTLTLGGASVALPVHVQDGQHPGTLEAMLGYGRTHAGRVADLTREDGYSVDLRPLLRGLTSTASISAAQGTYVLANLQGHHRMEGRDIARSDVRELHAKDPGAKRRRARAVHWQTGTDGKAKGNLSMWGTSHPAHGHKWGMVIDIDACTGCNACIVACSSENNVPVVGRDEVRRSREMHWIRVDRYYTSRSKPGATGPDRLDVEAVQQPVMCQQCDNAPCEAVCPANATMHNEEGINLQIYNRCIGTRYCSNNCPYKVRRFNWYEYSKYRAGPQGTGSTGEFAKPLTRLTRSVAKEGTLTASSELAHAPLQMLLNPEVTVRSKGVMEKCNLCLQRTRDIRYREKGGAGAPARKLADGAIVTACAQTCPTKAITFGDLLDSDTAVAKTLSERRDEAYLMLDAELNTRPGVSYLPRMYQRPATSIERDELAAATTEHDASHGVAAPKGGH